MIVAIGRVVKGAKLMTQIGNSNLQPLKLEVLFGELRMRKSGGCGIPIDTGADTSITGEQKRSN